jgi:EAL domain-containing protein (putative c-di-GMP-specific phosphodiesterase class I)
LRLALKERRLIPYFQPIVDCQGGALFASEAFARMVTREGDVIAAVRFIETIERHGLGGELDRAILDHALNMLREYGATQRLFLNLAPQEIRESDILAHAASLCRRLDIAPAQIIFELLARDATVDIDATANFLARLHAQGFAFVLDDFGRNSDSSLKSLRKLKVDYIKIGGNFVRSIGESEADWNFVQNLSRLCQDIGIKTVAENVEQVETLRTLQQMGIDYVQGYHLGMPQPTIPQPRDFGMGKRARKSEQENTDG